MPAAGRRRNRILAVSDRGGAVALVPAREARAAADSPRRLPVQGRRGPDHLRRQGARAARPRALVLPGLAAAGVPQGAHGRRDRRPRARRHRQRDGGARAREQPDQAPQAAVQRAAARRQEPPVPQAHAGRGVPAALRRAAAGRGRQRLRRALHPGEPRPAHRLSRAQAVRHPLVQGGAERPPCAALPAAPDRPLPRAVRRRGLRARSLPPLVRGRAPVPRGTDGRGRPAAAAGDGARRGGAALRGGRLAARPGAGAAAHGGAAEDHDHRDRGARPVRRVRGGRARGGAGLQRARRQGRGARGLPARRADRARAGAVAHGAAVLRRRALRAARGPGRVGDPGLRAAAVVARASGAGRT